MGVWSISFPFISEQFYSVEMTEQTYRRDATILKLISISWSQFSSDWIRRETEKVIITVTARDRIANDLVLIFFLVHPCLRLTNIV